MKFSKRFFSLLLLVIFVFANISSLPVSASTFSDVTGTEKYANAVTFLNSLGVINGYEDGTFKPLNNVTRAEFTAMLMRYRGLGTVGSTALENPPYPDVTTSDVSWAIGNIRTAQSLGIVNGYEDGTFRPQNNVLFEEAVKMIICAIGYAEYSPEGTQWFSKYITSATKLGILKGADGGVGTPATRACIAQLLFNCNDVKVVDNGGFNVGGGSILDSQLNLTEKTGIIYSNKVTSLSTPDVNLRDNEILIYNSKDDEPEVYTIKSDSNVKISDCYSRLGYKAKLYYEYDRDADRKYINSISYVTNSSDDVLTINAADIIEKDTDSTSITYYDDSDENTVAISENSIVVYNGKLYGSDSKSSTFKEFLNNESLPLIGTIKLIENSNDRTYDIVFIDSYEIYVATGVSGGTEYTVTDTLTRIAPNNTLKLDSDDKNLIISDKNNSSLSLSSIKKNSVLCVKKSNNNGTVLTTVVVSNNPVTGEIKGSSKGRWAKIGSTTYNYSNAAPWMRDDSQVSMSEPIMGDNGTYYLDLNGDIVAYTKSATVSNQQYAYIIDAYKESEGLSNDVLYLELYTQKNGLKMYACDKKVKINGTSKEIDEIITVLEEAEDYQGQNVDKTTNETGLSQLVKISTKTVDGNVVISDILTAEQGGNISEVTSDKLQMSDLFLAKNRSAVYNSTGKKLTASGKSANIRNSFIIKVPNDRSEEKKYKTVSLNDLSNGSSYRAEIYDFVDDGTAKAVVLYDLEAEIGVVTAKTPTFVVTAIEMSDESPDGENRYKVTGHNKNSKTETEIWSSTESEDVFSSINVGDVIRLGEDSEGYATLDTKDILFGIEVDRDEVIAEYASGGSLDGEDSDSGRYNLYKIDDAGSSYRVVWGYVYACGGENLLIHDYKFDNKNSVDSIAEHNYDVSSMSNTLFLEYETDKSGNLTIKLLNNETGFDKAEKLKGLSKLADGVEPEELFIFDVNGIPQLIIISK